MIKNNNFLLVIYLLFYSLTACATPALWKATNPNEYVAISSNYISENELKTKGIKYHQDKDNGLFYIEKDNLAKLKDYSIRIFATPVTVVVDATLSIFVVGALGAIYIIDNEFKSDEKKRKAEKIKRETKCDIEQNCRYDKNTQSQY